MPADVRARAEAGLLARLSTVIAEVRALKPAPTLAVFWPIRGEPDLRAGYRQWVDAGVALALPVTPDETGPLRFVAWPPGSGLRTDRFGVSSPVGQPEVVPDALLLPCVGFSEGAWRLGYGGGYYDRTLAARPVPAYGVAFDACEWPALPREAHDVPLTAVITECRVLTADDGRPAPV